MSTSDQSRGALPALAPLALCAGVGVAFTGRYGGVSHGPFGTLNLSDGVGDEPADVATNRELVLRAIGPGPRRLSWLRQVHGTDVVRIEDQIAAAGAGQAVQSPQGDAAFTDVPGIALGVLGADCAPVLVADAEAGLVGAAHAGRPGMAAGVVPALVAAMTAAGAQPARMHAIVGPAICGRCYEVPAGLQAEVAAAAPGSACFTSAGTPGIDLRAGLHAQLTALGMASVRDDARCTRESADLYSYRRDGTSGRFAGLIWLAS